MLKVNVVSKVGAMEMVSDKFEEKQGVQFRLSQDSKRSRTADELSLSQSTHDTRFKIAPAVERQRQQCVRSTKKALLRRQQWLLNHRRAPVMTKALYRLRIQGIMILNHQSVPVKKKAAHRLRVKTLILLENQTAQAARRVLHHHRMKIVFQTGQQWALATRRLLHRHQMKKMT